MNRRVVLGVIVAFIVASAIAVAQESAYAKEYKIGYVDLAKVFDEYQKTKEMSKAVEDKVKVKEAERKKLVDEVRKLKDEQALLSEKAKAEKQVVIDEKVKSLQEFDKKTQGELIKERNDAISGIMKDIEKVITDYSKEANYDFVLNSRALLYGTEQLDLTGEILKRLNKK